MRNQKPFSSFFSIPAPGSNQVKSKQDKARACLVNSAPTPMGRQLYKHEEVVHPRRAEKNVAITTDGPQSNCEHSLTIQNSCKCVAWTTQIFSTSRTAGRTAWVSAPTRTRKTPSYS